MSEQAERPSSWLNFVSAGGLAALGVSAALFQIARLQDGRIFELDRAQVLDSLSYVCRLDHMLPLLVAVRGRITCREPSMCQLNGAQAVMRELVEEEVYLKEHPGGRTSQECFEVRREQEQREAFLEDRSGAIRLENLQHAAGLTGVMQVKQEFRPAELLQHTLLQAVISKALKSMVKHGVRITERYLPLDTTVTVVGELVTDSLGSGGAGCSDGGSSRAQLAAASTSPPPAQQLQPPAVEATRAGSSGDGAGGVAAATAAAVTAAGAELLGQAALQALPYTLRMPGRGPFHVTSMTLPQLRSSLERTSGVIRAFAWGFGVLGAVLVVRKAAQAYHRLQTYRRFRRYISLADAARRAPAAAGTGVGSGGTAADGDDDAVRGPGTCVVCLDRESDVVFGGCGHMCVCFGCSVRVSKCPICRVASRQIRVYRP